MDQAPEFAERYQTLLAAARLLRLEGNYPEAQQVEKEVREMVTAQTSYFVPASEWDTVFGVSG